MYSTAGWENFFVAEAGASAALLGLLFVAVSINLAKVLELVQLPGRAIEALLELFAVLLVATCGLVPGQSTQLLGVEILVVGLVASFWPLVLQLRTPKVPGAPLSWTLIHVVLAQLSALPVIAAGVSLLVGRGGGLYWIVPGVVLALASALVNGWVLLVEIHR